MLSIYVYEISLLLHPRNFGYVNFHFSHYFVFSQVISSLLYWLRTCCLISTFVDLQVSFCWFFSFHCDRPENTLCISFFLNLRLPLWSNKLTYPGEFSVCPWGKCVFCNCWFQLVYSVVLFKSCFLTALLIVLSIMGHEVLKSVFVLLSFYPSVVSMLRSSDVWCYV